MNFETYKNHPALNQSRAKIIIEKSPLHFREWEKSDTSAMATGRLIHTAILQPELINKQFVVSPFDDFRKIEAKAWKAETLASGVEIVKESDLSTALSISRNVYQNSGAGELLKSAEKEVPIFGELEGVECKGLIDAVCKTNKGIILIDLKTAADASLRGMETAVGKYKYHFQAAWYMDLYYQANGEHPAGFAFLALEKTIPFATGYYQLNEAAIMAGREEYREALRIYKQCEESGIWPGYESKTIDLPKWLQWQHSDIYMLG
jgi:exodeoxyribonuclease VIII